MSISNVRLNTSTSYADKQNKAKKSSDDKENKVAAEQKQDSYKASDSKQIGKMSAADRANLVNQLKADQEQKQQQLLETVRKMIGQQGNAFGQANDLLKFIANGKFTVDAETKLQAQKDIADDGYWGVEKTSERIFDFAQALAGDDKEKMKKMQDAFEKGFKQATAAWGKDLPDICARTRDAVKSKFEAYFKESDTAKETDTKADKETDKSEAASKTK